MTRSHSGAPRAQPSANNIDTNLPSLSEFSIGKAAPPSVDIELEHGVEARLQFLRLVGPALLDLIHDDLVDLGVADSLGDGNREDMPTLVDAGLVHRRQQLVRVLLLEPPGQARRRVSHL